MSRSLRYALCGVSVFLISTLLGCGGSSSPVPGGPQGPQLGGLPAPQPGVQMPTLPPDSFDVENPDRGASAIYKVFFRDTVNHQSAGRWTVSNNAGFKQWTLSNTFFSSPKSWVVGGNYWYNEDDELISTSFDVEDGTDGLALTFYVRNNVAVGDHATVFFWDGDSWEQVVDFTNSSNINYPNWDKYYFQLPANNSGMTQSCQIAFQLTSDGATNSWGFGVDNVAVYQTQLGAPTNLVASDGSSNDQVLLTWDHNNVGTLIPDGYAIYRSYDNNGAPAEYFFHGSVTYPTEDFTDPTGDSSFYWYKVVAVKSGWPDSPSSEDTGWGGGAWNTTTAAATGDVGYYTSLALANGKPAVAYYDNDTGDLNYSYSTQEDGNSGWTEVTVDSTGNVGDFYPSFALIGGKPAISYYDAGNSDLKYAYSSTVDGSGGWNTVDVDTTGNAGQYTSLALINGKPAISYYDQGNKLRYAYSSQNDGSSGWTIVAADTSTEAGIYTSLADINGKPAIAHFNGSTHDLLYTYSSQVDGSSGWSTVNVDSTGTVGLYPSLALVNGKPAISYYDSTNDSLKYAYSSQTDGSSGWNSLVVHAGAGEYTSLAVVFGKPAISYFDGGADDLRYAESTAVDGSSGWNHIALDSNGVTGKYTSLHTLTGGQPAIAYFDDTNDDLRFAWYN